MTKQSKWTNQEEQYLKILKEEKCISDWRAIAKELSLKFPDTKRRSKQCRERYMNYTRFGGFSASSLDWTTDEEQIIFQKYFEYGSSWKLLSQALSKRSQNCIKNKFYSGIRKFIRRFNSVPCQSYKIKFQTIKRMLKATDPISRDNERADGQFKDLRLNILKFSQISAIPLQIEDIKRVKEMLIEFNKEMRYLCLKKKTPLSAKGSLNSRLRHKKSAVTRKPASKIESVPEKDSERQQVMISSAIKEDEREFVKIESEKEPENEINEENSFKQGIKSAFTIPEVPQFVCPFEIYPGGFQFFPQNQFMMQFNGFNGYFYPSYM